MTAKQPSRALQQSAFQGTTAATACCSAAACARELPRGRTPRLRCAAGHCQLRAGSQQRRRHHEAPAARGGLRAVPRCVWPPAWARVRSVDSRARGPALACQLRWPPLHTAPIDCQASLRQRCARPRVGTSGCPGHTLACATCPRVQAAAAAAQRLQLGVPGPRRDCPDRQPHPDGACPRAGDRRAAAAGGAGVGHAAAGGQRGRRAGGGATREAASAQMQALHSAAPCYGCLPPAHAARRQHQLSRVLPAG